MGSILIRVKPETIKLAFAVSQLRTKHMALRSKHTDWLARNHDNIPKWGTCLSADIYFNGLAP